MEREPRGSSHSSCLMGNSSVNKKRRRTRGKGPSYLEACIFRLIWLLFFRPDSVWVQWFKEVILKGSVHNYWTTTPKQSYSWLVNKLLKMKNEVFPLIKLRLQNGQLARFWSDNWSPFEALSTHLSGRNSRLGIPLNGTVSSLCPNGSWVLPPARNEVQLQLYAYLTTVQLTEEQDYYEWEINGKTYTSFKTGILYDYLIQQLPDVSWYASVWFSRAIPRHSFHMWLLIQNRLPTRDRLNQWGLQVDPKCLLCNRSPETRDHLFFYCHFSYDLWMLVARRLDLAPMRDWAGTLQQMTSLSLPLPQKLLVLLAWQATAYWLWNERNARLHANTFRSTDQLFKQIDRQLRNKLQSFRESNPNRSSLMMQSWFRFG